MSLSPKEYAAFVKEAATVKFPRTDEMRAHISDENLDRLEHAVMGLAGEVGELTSEVRAHIRYGKELDKLNVVEEAGDIIFYTILAVLAVNPEATVEDIVAMNVRKLQKRYPNGFTAERALNRDVSAEREAMAAD